MTGPTFVVNITKRGPLQVRRTVHRPACRWAGRSRRHYRCDTAEAVRLFERAHLDNLTHDCHYCHPLQLAMLMADAT